MESLFILPHHHRRNGGAALPKTVRETFVTTPKRTPQILIVEDDAEIGRLLVETMGENGMQATAVEDGHAMFAQLRRQPFDLVILDVMLPGEDGISLCRRLRADRTIPSSC